MTVDVLDEVGHYVRVFGNMWGKIEKKSVIDFPQEWILASGLQDRWKNGTFVFLYFCILAFYNHS